MKRCPECRRDYYDDSLLFCLDDGATLLEGPATDETKTKMLGVTNLTDEPQTAILNNLLSEAPTNQQINRTAKTEILPKDEIEKVTERLPNESPQKIWLIAILVGVLAIGGYFAYKYLSPKNNQINSIAVLPFENRSGNADSDYLSDGLAESLIYRLSQLPDLKVRPTSSVFRYKGKEADPQVVAKELGVDSVMTGKVTQRGENITISVNLVDTRNGKSLWGEQYERKMSELLTTQREIASEITNKLQLKLSGAGEQKLTKKYTDNNEAYQLYLKGRFFAAKRTSKDARQAMEYYQQAVAVDPNFALAYSGLAEANWFLAIYSYPQQNNLIPTARELAVKAINLDGTLAEPHSLLGALVAVSDHDPGVWDRETRLSIELNPNYAEGHRRRGLFFRSIGNLKEARVSFERALELDPLSPVANFNYAELLLFEGKYDESETLSKKNIDLDPTFWYAHKQLHEVYRRKKDYPSAIESLAKMQEARGEPDAALLIRESFRNGGWNGFLKAMTGQRERAKLYPFYRATYYAELGDKDGTFGALNEAFNEQDQHIVQYLKVDPYLELIRDDPRYTDLLRRMKLPE